MLELYLLGCPRAIRDGRPVETVRGLKAWVLLAYLLLVDGPLDRRRLAALLFPDAADPAATLRWNLSQLRRSLGIALVGDPVALHLPPDAWVDIMVLARGDASAAAAVTGGDQQLLEGISFDDHDPLMLWLEGERRHIAALAVDVLREAAVRQLSRGDAKGAVILAERVVQLDPLDENGAVLLVRSLREAGRHGDAVAVAKATTIRLRDELGLEPSSMLSSAAHASIGGAARSGGVATVEAQLDAGEAAIAAGVPDAGIDALREALGGARAIGEPALLARCLTALGGALIHALRGNDQDGLALLHEAIPAAVAGDLPGIAARASRELGYVDVLRGRYERAQRWFADAAPYAAGDDEELAWIAAFAGTARTDVTDYLAAAGHLDEAIGRATAAGSLQAAAYALAMRGRLRLFADDESGAAEDLDGSVAAARAAAWRSFLPWPQTLQAEIAYRRGDLDHAISILQPALAISLQVGDPCWESMSLRGLGLASFARGELANGLELLRDAPRQCRRLPDTYIWIEVYGLDALADATSQRGLEDAGRWIQQLEDASTRHGMRALSANAARYRRR